MMTASRLLDNTCMLGGTWHGRIVLWQCEAVMWRARSIIPRGRLGRLFACLRRLAQDGHRLHSFYLGTWPMGPLKAIL